MRVADKELGARKPKPATRLPRRQCNASGVPAQIGFRPGERRLRAAGSDLRQPFPALRRRTGFGDRRTAEQYRRQKRAGHDCPPHFFHQYDEVDETEPAAALLLGVDDPQPTLVGELLPELVSNLCRLRHSLADELGRAFALEKPPRAVAQKFLFLGKP